MGNPESIGESPNASLTSLCLDHCKISRSREYSSHWYHSRAYHHHEHHCYCGQTVRRKLYYHALWQLISITANDITYCLVGKLDSFTP